MWVMYLTQDQTISINIRAQNETSDFIENYNESPEITVAADTAEVDTEEDMNII